VDRFDLTGRATAGKLFKPDGPAILAVAFSTDGLYPPSEVKAIAAAAGNRGAYFEVETDAGHDAFLLPNESLFARVRTFLV
jgi:homoserine O-acetyltransferase